MGGKLRRAPVVAAALMGVLTTALSLSVLSPASSTTRRATPPYATVTVASFNLLGASHTPAGGRWATAATRMGWTKQLLEQHHVQVAGFQEMQATQVSRFQQLMGSSWALYPGATLGARAGENSIGWRTDAFDLVQAGTVNIPYFDGNLRPMPVVVLRERSTGLMAYFTNVHNPADTAQYRNQGAYRAEATRIEIALQNKLAASGLPRFLTGDMNERASYFCRVVAGAPMRAARPQSTYVGGVCDAGNPRAVDWLLGAAEQPFSGYLEDRGDLVDKTSDHPMIVSDATLDAAVFPQALAAAPPPPLDPNAVY
jgi:hypothetical protein